MSKRQQRLSLTELAGTLREIAIKIEKIGAPGLLGLRRLDKEVAAGSGKPNDADLAAAEMLEKTAKFYSERVLPRPKSITGRLRALIR